jgi:transketolase
MRKAFIAALEKIVQENDDFMLITPDLGFNVFDDFKVKHKKNFLNCGVSEANAIGMAAGMALNGKKVFVYSIVPFITMRCYEQIRNDVAYHNLDVKIVGVGGGYGYGIMGTTHHAVEDIGLMRLQPNMKVVCPGDPIETEYATKSLFDSKGPAYLRLGKVGEKEIHKRPLNFELGKAIIVKEGTDLTLISTGNMLENTINVAELLSKENINTRVLSMHTVKPLDKDSIYDSALKTKKIYTIEEHAKIGGLGSAVAEVLSQSNYNYSFKMFGVNDEFLHVAGTQDYLRGLQGLKAEQISEEIKKDL